jgi:plastocyanin
VKSIRLEADSSRDEYRFTPATVSARPGDVLVFKVVSGSPHSIVFREQGLTREAHEALNAALPHRAADLSSPLLTASGQEYRVTVPQLPPGTYPFFCLPHRAYDMRGELLVR